MAQIYALNTGYFWVDGGAIFGVVPRVLWERAYTPDEKNRIRQALRAFLIVDGDRKIIIDAGLGNWYDQKFLERYVMENPDFDFDQALSVHGLSTSDITDVIITHLHFDHAGGLAVKRGEKIEPVFPKACLWLQQPQWQWAQKPSPKDHGSYLEPYMTIINESKNLKLIDGSVQISPAVSVLPFHGHTPGMQTVLVQSDAGTSWFPSDLIPFSEQLRISWVMAYDNNSVLTAEEKEKMLQKAIQEKWDIYFYHDPVYEKATSQMIEQINAGTKKK